MKRRNDSTIRETTERTEQDRFWMEESDRAEGMEEDDGHMVADMSDVPHGLSGGWHLFGGRVQNGNRRQRENTDVGNRNRQSEPWEDAPFSWRERRMYTFGALKAAFLIGMVYLVGLGLLIGLMVLVW